MKPQNLLLPPQPTLRKWQRFLPFLPCPACCYEQQQVQEWVKVKHPSREGSPDPHRGALSSWSLTGAMCNCGQQPAGAHRAGLLLLYRAPKGGIKPTLHPTKPTCGSATAGKCIWQTPLFTNSSNLEDKAPSLPPAPEKGSRDTLAAVHHPAVKARSSPLPALAGTTVLARALSWPWRDFLPLPAAFISWRRCRRGRSHQGSSPGAPRPGGAAQLGG